MEESLNETKKTIIKRELTIEERKAIARLKQKGSITSQPIFRVDNSNDTTLEFALDESLEHRNAVDLLDSQIMEATGTADRNAGLRLLINICKTIAPTTKKEVAVQLVELTHSMRTLAPQDEYEGQLVAQLIVLHEHAMDWLGRAIRTERVDFANVYLNGASKLLTRHHETLEALLKYRRKGEQRVHVEHVHVHSGAQAIVGNVTGGGLKPQIEEGPHAKV